MAGFLLQQCLIFGKCSFRDVCKDKHRIFNFSSQYQMATQERQRPENTRKEPPCKRQALSSLEKYGKIGLQWGKTVPVSLEVLSPQQQGSSALRLCFLRQPWGRVQSPGRVSPTRWITADQQILWRHSGRELSLLLQYRGTELAQGTQIGRMEELCYVCLGAVLHCNILSSALLHCCSSNSSGPQKCIISQPWSYLYRT